MPDDPPRPKRAQTSTERDEAGLRALRMRTPPRGYPIEVDPELTPRPSTIEDIRTLPVHEQLAKIVAAQNQSAKAIAYEQDQRNEARRTGEQLAVLTKSMERIEPALVKAHETATIVDDMRRDVRDMKAHVSTLIESQARDDERRISVDEKFERTLRAIGGVDEAQRRAEARVEVLAERVDTIDRAHQETRGRVATGEVKVTHLDKRVAITRARLGKGDKALVGSGFVGAGVVGHFFSDLITWISSHFH